MNYELAFRADSSGRPESIGIFVAQCQDADIASDGATEEDAVAALKEALALYFEPTPNAHSPLSGKLSRFDNLCLQPYKSERP